MKICVEYNWLQVQFQIYFDEKNENQNLNSNESLV